MNVLISGASGLIGRSLVEELPNRGHTVRRLVRREATGEDEVSWNPGAGEIAAGALTGIDAIVHLAGENVASGRWTRRRRQAILSSRVDGLRTLTAALSQTRARPAVFVSASAVGFYGDAGDTLLDEASDHGDRFLADVCQQWEAGLHPLETMGLRTVAVRIGVVLSSQGGALAKMLPAFRAGLGGRIGDGRQWMSWISLEDLTRVFRHMLEDDRWRGPVNAVAPVAVRNHEFTRTLAEVIHRPAAIPVPAALLRLVLGGMADETLLASTRVTPKRLLEGGFEFRHPNLKSALRHELGRRADN